MTRIDFCCLLSSVGIRFEPFFHEGLSPHRHLDASDTVNLWIDAVVLLVKGCPLFLCHVIIATLRYTPISHLLGLSIHEIYEFFAIQAAISIGVRRSIRLSRSHHALASDRRIFPTLSLSMPFCLIFITERIVPFGKVWEQTLYAGIDDGLVLITCAEIPKLAVELHPEVLPGFERYSRIFWVLFVL